MDGDEGAPLARLAGHTQKGQFHDQSGGPLVQFNTLEVSTLFLVYSTMPGCVTEKG